MPEESYYTMLQQQIEQDLAQLLASSGDVTISPFESIIEIQPTQGAIKAAARAAAAVLVAWERGTNLGD